MSLTTAVLARNDAHYTARLEPYLSSLRSVCAHEEAYKAALQKAKDRAEKSELTLIEAVEVTALEIATGVRLQPTT
jgi:hypothetical protein